MTFFRQYHWVVGLLLLAAVITVFVGTPDIFFGTRTTFIYSNLSDPSKHQTYVRTNMDFGNNERIREFPMDIGDWQGRDFPVDPWKEQLGADVALMRGYRKPGATQEIWFLAMQSKSRSSFHPPEACYPALGFTIEEEGYEIVPGENADWLEAPLYPKFSESQATVRLKKMLVSKGKAGVTEEHRLILYFYVKHGSLGAMSDVITMIRISAIVPRSDDSYEQTLELEKELLLEFIPIMFEPAEKEDIIIVQLAEKGAGGIFLIILGFAVPGGIILYPQAGRLSRKIIPGFKHR